MIIGRATKLPQRWPGPPSGIYTTTRQARIHTAMASPCRWTSHVHTRERPCSHVHHVSNRLARPVDQQISRIVDRLEWFGRGGDETKRAGRIDETGRRGTSSLCCAAQDHGALPSLVQVRLAIGTPRRLGRRAESSTNVALIMSSVLAPHHKSRMRAARLFETCTGADVFLKR